MSLQSTLWTCQITFKYSHSLEERTHGAKGKTEKQGDRPQSSWNNKRLVSAALQIPNSNLYLAIIYSEKDFEQQLDKDPLNEFADTKTSTVRYLDKYFIIN
jgi:hypothetical protein